MLRTLFLIVPFLLLVHVTSAAALPPCNGDYTGPCYGSLYLGEGQKYVGGFRDGTRHGQGTHTFPDGKKYVGEFRDSKKHGYGTFTWPHGDKYVGEYKYGKKHGQMFL